MMKNIFSLLEVELSKIMRINQIIAEKTNKK